MNCSVGRKESAILTIFSGWRHLFSSCGQYLMSNQRDVVRLRRGTEGGMLFWLSFLGETSFRPWWSTLDIKPASSRIGISNLRMKRQKAVEFVGEARGGGKFRQLDSPMNTSTIKSKISRGLYLYKRCDCELDYHDRRWLLNEWLWWGGDR